MAADTKDSSAASREDWRPKIIDGSVEPEKILEQLRDRAREGRRHEYAE